MGETKTLALAMHVALMGKASVLFLPSTEVRLVPEPESAEAGYTLDQLRGILGLEDGHYIEIVSMIRGVSRMVVDDEGANIPLPVNNPASFLYSRIGGNSPIHGPALVVPWDSIK